MLSKRRNPTAPGAALSGPGGLIRIQEAGAAPSPARAQEIDHQFRQRVEPDDPYHQAAGRHRPYLAPFAYPPQEYQRDGCARQGGDQDDAPQPAGPMHGVSKYDYFGGDDGAEITADQGAAEDRGVAEHVVNGGVGGALV